MPSSREKHEKEREKSRIKPIFIDRQLGALGCKNRKKKLNIIWRPKTQRLKRHRGGKVKRARTSVMLRMSCANANANDLKKNDRGRPRDRCRTRRWVDRHRRRRHETPLVPRFPRPFERLRTNSHSPPRRPPEEDRSRRHRRRGDDEAEVDSGGSSPSAVEACGIRLRGIMSHPRLLYTLVAEKFCPTSGDCSSGVNMSS